MGKGKGGIDISEAFAQHLRSQVKGHEDDPIQEELKGFLKEAPEADFDEYYDKPTTRS